MIDFVLSRGFLELLVRTLLPLAAAVALGWWLADLVGGAGGVVLGVLLGAATMSAWLTTGYRGDAARAGRPLVYLPTGARLTGEAAVLGGSVVALAAGLDAVAPAIALACIGAAYVAARIVGARRAAPAPVSGTDAAAETPTPATPDWSRRGDDGSFQFGRTIALEAPLDEVWDFVWSFEQLAACIPGCEGVDEHVPHRSYTAQVRKKLGPFLIRMPLEIEIESYEERRAIRAAVVGRDQRLRSEVAQRLDVTLTAAGSGSLLQAVVGVSISGVLASVDANLVERNLDQTIGEFAAALNARLADRQLGSAAR